MKKLNAHRPQFLNRRHRGYILPCTLLICFLILSWLLVLGLETTKNVQIIRHERYRVQAQSVSFAVQPDLKVAAEAFFVRTACALEEEWQQKFAKQTPPTREEVRQFIDDRFPFYQPIEMFYATLVQGKPEVVASGYRQVYGQGMIKLDFDAIEVRTVGGQPNRVVIPFTMVIPYRISFASRDLAPSPQAFLDTYGSIWHPPTGVLFDAKTVDKTNDISVLTKPNYDNVIQYRAELVLVLEKPGVEPPVWNPPAGIRPGKPGPCPVTVQRNPDGTCEIVNCNGDNVSGGGTFTDCAEAQEVADAYNQNPAQGQEALNDAAQRGTFKGFCLGLDSCQQPVLVDTSQYTNLEDYGETVDGDKPVDNLGVPPGSLIREAKVRFPKEGFFRGIPRRMRF
ncbi:MAG TPA: hypothetical protein PLU80_11750 [Acidobacteriota bacterium]|nr:hypothetical protein [Acidobacteriota bacterium]HNC44832.1 hypothetical protein [Acidobacteriota bacterium]HNH82909.1 hypothetical protein [Acidobacteriota bacterium]